MRVYVYIYIYSLSPGSLKIEPKILLESPPKPKPRIITRPPENPQNPPNPISNQRESPNSTTGFRTFPSRFMLTHLNIDENR